MTNMMESPVRNRPALSRRALLLTSAMLSAGLLLGPLLGSAHAQSGYPNKPVRVVVPFGPGGIADTSLRIVAEKLTGELGQQVIVENQPGAGGIIAANKVLKSDADGYTLAFLTNGTAISVPLFKKLPFDPLSDFAPVSSVSFFDFVLVTKRAVAVPHRCGRGEGGGRQGRRPQPRHHQRRQQPEPFGGVAQVGERARISRSYPTGRRRTFWSGCCGTTSI